MNPPLEECMLLRLPDDVADAVREGLRSGKPPRLELIMGAEGEKGKPQRGTLNFNGENMSACLSSLPTVVEVHKSLDDVTMYQTLANHSGTVRQVIDVSRDDSQLPTEAEQRNGLTPPMVDVKKQMWRKGQPRKPREIDQVQLELSSLLSGGIPTHYELVEVPIREPITHDGGGTSAVDAQAPDRMQSTEPEENATIEPASIEGRGGIRVTVSNPQAERVPPILTLRTTVSESSERTGMGKPVSTHLQAQERQAQQLARQQQQEMLDLKAEAEAAAMREQLRQQAAAAREAEAQAAALAQEQADAEEERRRQESAVTVAALKKQLGEAQRKEDAVKAELAKASIMLSNSNNQKLRERMQPKVNSLNQEQAAVQMRIRELQKEIDSHGVL